MIHHMAQEVEIMCVYKAKEASHLILLLHLAQSPDLNPMEAIWAIIKERLRWW
jgi:hypothetical protein